MSKSTALAAWMKACSLVEPIKLRRGSANPEAPPPAASAGPRGVVGGAAIVCRLFSFWNFFSMLVTLSVPAVVFLLLFALASDAALKENQK